MAAGWLVGDAFAELEGAGGKFLQRLDNRNAYPLSCNNVVHVRFGAANGTSSGSYGITLVY